MDLQEFLDKLYQTFSNTTGAEHRIWTVFPDADGTFSLHAVHAEENPERLAQGLSEADADFLATIHGSLPDLVRRTLAAIDSEERSALERDQQEGRIADLELEIMGLKLELGR